MKKINLLILILSLSILFYGCAQKTADSATDLQPLEDTTSESPEIGAEYEKQLEGPEIIRQTPEEPIKEITVKEFHVEGYRFRFEPDPIEVNFGDKVKINFESEDTTHGLSIPDFGINIKSSGSAEFIANKKGTFTFRCSVYCGSGHSSMTGTLIVK